MKGYRCDECYNGFHFRCSDELCNCFCHQPDQPAAPGPEATPEPPAETVNHPQHYGGEGNPYEAILVIEAWGLDKSFCLGNCLKYIARADHKGNRLEDLRKARWYLDREITRQEAGS